MLNSDLKSLIQGLKSLFCIFDFCCVMKDLSSSSRAIRSSWVLIVRSGFMRWSNERPLVWCLAILTNEVPVDGEDSMLNNSWHETSCCWIRMNSKMSSESKFDCPDLTIIKESCATFRQFLAFLWVWGTDLSGQWKIFANLILKFHETWKTMALKKTHWRWWAAWGLRYLEWWQHYSDYTLMWKSQWRQEPRDSELNLEPCRGYDPTESHLISSETDVCADHEVLFTLWQISYHDLSGKWVSSWNSLSAEIGVEGTLRHWGTWAWWERSAWFSSSKMIFIESEMILSSISSMMLDADWLSKVVNWGSDQRRWWPWMWSGRTRPDE